MQLLLPMKGNWTIKKRITHYFELSAYLFFTSYIRLRNPMSYSGVKKWQSKQDCPPDRASPMKLFANRYNKKPIIIELMRRKILLSRFSANSGHQATSLFYLLLAMSKTPHIQYLCGFARHGKPLYHSKFIETTSSKWYY